MSVKIESKKTWELFTRPPLSLITDKVKQITDAFTHYPSGVRIENLCENQCAVTCSIEEGVIVVRITPNPDHFQL